MPSTTDAGGRRARSSRQATRPRRAHRWGCQLVTPGTATDPAKQGEPAPRPAPSPAPPAPTPLPAPTPVLHGMRAGTSRAPPWVTQWAAVGRCFCRACTTPRPPLRDRPASPSLAATCPAAAPSAVPLPRMRPRGPRPLGAWRALRGPGRVAGPRSFPPGGSPPAAGRAGPSGLFCEDTRAVAVLPREQAVSSVAAREGDALRAPKSGCDGPWCCLARL